MWDPTLTAWQVMGVTLHQIASDITFSDFALQTVDLTVTRPAPLFGIWSRQEQPDTVTVAEGEAVLAVNGMDIAVEAGQGYFADGIQTTATAIDAPYSAARVLEIDPATLTTRLIGEEIPGGLIASDALRPDEGLIPSGANKFARQVASKNLLPR